MAAASVDNKLQFYIWTGQKGNNLRSQLTSKLWHKTHKTLTHTHTNTHTHTHMNANTNITQLKTFKERSKIYEFNSSFEWPQWAKVDSFWHWQCIPDVNYALAEKRLSNVDSAMFFWTAWKHDHVLQQQNCVWWSRRINVNNTKYNFVTKRLLVWKVERHLDLITLSKSI